MERIIDTRERLDGVSSLHRIVFLRAAALRTYIEELEPPLVTALVGGGSGDLWNPMNNLTDIVCLLRADKLSELTIARAALAMIEGSEDYKAAAAIMTPILERIDADNAEIAERKRLEGEAANAEREALEAARAKAEAKVAADVAKDPAVVAARAALAKVAEDTAARELQADFK
ncbi:MAG: hypothetical protein EOP83_09700 [Verrucomicrobiaceae bacterium]|nr:MAG: hypothetical protein EOP83_09700 [Verrucomicrobiaceae bacterium]